MSKGTRKSPNKQSVDRMRTYLESLQYQIPEAIEIGSAVKLPAHYSRAESVVFCGVGGSAMSGDILMKLAKHSSPKPFIVSRDYRVPEWVGPKTLVIFSSFSGNTKETRAALTAAMRKKAKPVLVSSGGMMGKLAEKKRIPWVRIPEGLPPRCAIGYMTISLIPVLNRLRCVRVTQKEIRETLSILCKIKPEFARGVARKLAGRLPVIYGNGYLMEPVVKRWRGQFAENAKSIALGNFMPEMLHNEIEGWSHPRKLIPEMTAVYLEDSKIPLDLRLKGREAVRVLKKAGAKVVTFQIPGQSPLARIFAGVYLGDWVSYFLALENGEDPVAIPRIEAIKQI